MYCPDSEERDEMFASLPVWQQESENYPKMRSTGLNTQMCVTIGGVYSRGFIALKAGALRKTAVTFSPELDTQSY